MVFSLLKTREKKRKSKFKPYLVPGFAEEIADEAWRIYEEIFGIEYSKRVQDLLGYRFPERYWPALKKNELPQDEVEYVEALPKMLGEIVLSDSFVFTRPREFYQRSIADALDQPESSLQTLLVGYCCWRINQAKAGARHKWPF